MNSTTDNIIQAPTISYLNDLKNPCFAIDKFDRNAINITTSEAIRLGLDIHCLPYAYLAGKLTVFAAEITTVIYKYISNLDLSCNTEALYLDKLYLSFPVTIAYYYYHIYDIMI